MLDCHPHSRNMVLVVLAPYTSASLKPKFKAEVSPLETLPENSTGSLSPLHQSLRDKFLSHQYQKVSPFQANKEVSPSIPHCLSGGKWSVYTDTENTRLHNDEKLKWHSWSANWRSQQGIHSLFSSNRKILHLFQPQSQIKYELMNSQQLTPQIQIYMLKISKSTNASTQKVPLVFCSRYLSEKKIFVLETDLLNKKARTLQINAKWVLMTFLFSFDEFYFPLCEASTEKVLFWEVENYRLPREVALSKAFLGNLV